MSPDRAQLRTTNGDRNHIRFRYATANVIELFVALATILATLNYLLHPNDLARSAVGHASFYPDWVWNLTALAGALLVTLGILLLRQRLEMTGLVLFVAATLLQSISLYEYRGGIAASTIATSAGFAAALSVRSVQLWRAAEAQRVAVPPPRTERRTGERRVR